MSLLITVLLSSGSSSARLAAAAVWEDVVTAWPRPGSAGSISMAHQQPSCTSLAHLQVAGPAGSALEDPRAQRRQLFLQNEHYLQQPSLDAVDGAHRAIEALRRWHVAHCDCAVWHRSAAALRWHLAKDKRPACQRWTNSQLPLQALGALCATSRELRVVVKQLSGACPALFPLAPTAAGRKRTRVPGAAAHDA